MNVSLSILKFITFRPKQECGFHRRNPEPGASLGRQLPERALKREEKRATLTA